MNNLVLDSNILIYGINENSKQHKISKGILTSGKHNLFITSKSISEYFAVCTKLNIDREHIICFFNDIKENTIILYPCPESIKQFELLFKKYKPSGNRVYDIEIVSVMLASRLKNLATFNIQDFEMIEEITLFQI